MHFGVLLNKTISAWQGQNFPCYNKMNRNGARTVADQIVTYERAECCPYAGFFLEISHVSHLI